MNSNNPLADDEGEQLRLFRDVKEWCDPATRDATLVRCGHISDWDTSKVTKCNGLFSGKKDFNDDISRWDMSNVTAMVGMFNGASSFNQPLGAWNVSKVTDMQGMFYEATAFNQPLAAWDVSKVNDVRGMFQAARAFNQPLSEWNVSNVTWLDKMFVQCPIDPKNRIGIETSIFFLREEEARVRKAEYDRIRASKWFPDTDPRVLWLLIPVTVIVPWVLVGTVRIGYACKYLCVECRSA